MDKSQKQRDEIKEQFPGYSELLEAYISRLDELRDLREIVERQEKQHKEECEQLEKKSRTDALTGVLNRGGFMEDFRHLFAMHDRTNTPLALAVIDLDGFKPINDTYGHQVGDQLLQKVVQRMQGAIREADFLGRYGGDEFVIAFPETDIHGATRAVEKLMYAINEPFQIKELQDLHVGMSVGIAEAIHDAVDGVHELFNAADEKMYAMKEENRKKQK